MPLTFTSSLKHKVRLNDDWCLSTVECLLLLCVPWIIYIFWTTNCYPHSGVNFGDLIKYNVAPSDTAILPFSSGTTGTSKGVMLTHDNIVINCEQLHVPMPDTPLIPETTSDFQAVSPAVLPFFHIYGFTVCLMSKLKLRTKIIALPKFQPETFMKAVIVEKGSILHLVPPISEYTVVVIGEKRSDWLECGFFFQYYSLRDILASHRSMWRVLKL